MNMPRQIESKQDWEDMCTFLEEQDKDRLIDFIMSNLGNAEFYKRVYAYFGTREGETITAEGLFEAYKNELMLEYESDSPDTDYIVSFSQKFADMAEALPKADKQIFLTKMADFLRTGIEEYAVGLQEDDDWLVTDFMKDVCGVAF